MSRLISAILYRVSFKRYLRYRSGRVLSGKELTPVTYRPKRTRTNN